MEAHLKKIGLALAWCTPVLMIVVMVFWYRKTGGQPPVPFLLLFAAVLAASFGGLLAGTLAAAIASVFVVYAAIIGFGPSSLTGNLVVATAGCILYLLVGHRCRGRYCLSLAESIKVSNECLGRRVSVVGVLRHQLHGDRR